MNSKCILKQGESIFMMPHLCFFLKHQNKPKKKATIKIVIVVISIDWCTNGEFHPESKRIPDFLIELL